jgi:uncharacterized protein YdeI (YjbR/CyaY-like superfamily)
VSKTPKIKSAQVEIPTLVFTTPAAWSKWLDKHHATSPGVWIRFAKKASGIQSISYAEALETALCYGWIDSQKKASDDTTYIQKFTRRGARSVWSKVNREKALSLKESGRMNPAGLAEIERAQKDGRWEAAYDSPASAKVPADLQAALDTNPRAANFFATLKGRNRYAILFRVHTAKRAETRARRIADFVEMLARGEKIYP